MSQTPVDTVPNDAELFHLPGTTVMILITISTLLIAYEIWFRRLRYVKLGNKMPGPAPAPIIGSAYLAIGLSPRDIMKKTLNYYQYLKSDVGRLWIGPLLYVGLSDAADIELILGSNVHLEKAHEYKLFQPWLGDGLLISKGEKWRSHRKMIVPTFHSSILKSFVPVFNRNAEKVVESLKKELGKIFDVHDYMSETTVDTLLETAMGVKKTDGDKTGFEYAMAVMKMCTILHLRQMKLWLRPDFLFRFSSLSKYQKHLLNTIHSLTRKVIKRKKSDYFTRQHQGQQSLYQRAVNETTYDTENDKEGNTIMNNYIPDDLEENENDIGEKKRLAFLDYMIEASQYKENKLTDEEIKEEVDTIMFEGHDTTAAASSFVLCVLGIHQDIQDKVFEELKEIFQDDLYRPITFNDTVKMKYLERVILETIRMYPPVPLIARIVKDDVQLVSGDYTIPAGTTVVIGTYTIHRSPKYYTDPEKFNPDNFLPEKCQQRPYYAYIPFSAGPRSCVGRKYAMLKLKVILASVLRRYRTISTDKESDFKLQADIILKREEGFNIRIEERCGQC